MNKFTLKKKGRYFTGIGSDRGFFARGIGGCYSFTLEDAQRLQRSAGGLVIEIIETPTAPGRMPHYSERPLFISGQRICYNDGKQAAALADVLEVSEGGILVWFDDRADTTFIRFTDAAWMDHITILTEPTRAPDDWAKAGPIDKRTFDLAVLCGQNLQKYNPFGSELHRKGFEMVRQATIRFFGEDKLGEYEI